MYYQLKPFTIHGIMKQYHEAIVEHCMFNIQAKILVMKKNYK